MASTPKNSESNYWKRKISAYLHDSPNKALDILGHENSAEALARVFGFESDEKFRKDADFAASAADRIPWPRSKYCRSEYDIKENPFRHPLCGEKVSLDRIAHDAEAEAHRSMPVLHGDDFDDEHYRRAFLALWRLWQNWASEANPELGFYPPETRLPDHTIWSHLGVTSAMQGCIGGSRADWDALRRKNTVSLPDNPALLLFSIGPVQDFIAAARTTRDLWSGSYLLSYLISKALGEIARDFGPDHVIFPNLKGQPLIDWRLRKDWEDSKTSEIRNFWDDLDLASPGGRDLLLTPSLPNRFLALLPEKMTEHEGRESASDYASHLADEIREELKAIAKSIAERLSDEKCFIRDRFDHQVNTMLEIHWQIVPVSCSVEAVKERAEILPKDEQFNSLTGLNAVLDMVKNMPEEHRDDRYFRDIKDSSSLNQTAAAWPAFYALAGWQLDGVKSLRSFDAPNEGKWEKGRKQNNDSLTGREEACLIAPDSAEDCEKIRKECFPDAPKDSIKLNEFLGAATLIKRFWHVTHLADELGYHPRDFGMPNTHAIADHRPFDNNEEEDRDDEDSAKYFAVLALDGDEMGKWISGVKCPQMRDLLSEEAKDFFANNNNAGFLDAIRPLSPSFHLQFSEMLGNFALHCARRIVEAFYGRLIYAGGDDVLAMLPADTAIDCAAALRAAFRGDKELVNRLPDIFQEAPAGCIRLSPEAARKREAGDDPLVSDPHRFPVLVPGSTTDVSCGIAIGHIKSPLQDLVRAAQAAEKRAKTELNRAACAVSLFKRSGEILHWGFKWKDQSTETAPVLPFLKILLKATLTNRFPYKLTQLLDPYVGRTTNGGKSGRNTGNSFSEKAGDIVRLELRACLKQHLTESGDITKCQILKLFDTYWLSLATKKGDGGRDLAGEPEAKIQDLIGLLSTLAWISKNKPEKDNQLKGMQQ